MNKYDEKYAVIPVRDMIILPRTITPLLIGRKASIGAVDFALDTNKKIVCVAQKNFIESDNDPKAKDIYRVGTICNIIQYLKLPDGNIRLLVEGEERIKIERFSRTNAFLAALISSYNKEINDNFMEIEALVRVFKKKYMIYINMNKNIPNAAKSLVDENVDMIDFFYAALANIHISVDKKQKIFEENSLIKSFQNLYEVLLREIEILNLENKIDATVKNKLNKMQRDYYLTEQMNAINKELGINKGEEHDYMKLKKKLESLNLSEEARKKANEELNKLSRLSNNSPEYSVVHTYLTWITELPWAEPEMKDYTLKSAKEILDVDHYGLDKVKDRILEYLAVVKLAEKVKGQILCFVGPPGVGKTSLGKSIARAMDREFIRLSLGGVRDEAEIRGHRRTYVGALPGVIIQSMKKAGTKDPLIMMDEIDKMSSDFHGDPASALLEVLDPEQNDTFRDHYLDFDYDLSQVIFITTANTLNSIPRPLLDRMEIIEVHGYTAYEKINIATKHLVPKVLKEHDLSDKIEVKYNKTTLEALIKEYTREAGVRSLERQIAKILRKIAREYLEGNVSKKVTVKKSDLEKYLGIPRHLYSEVNRKDKVGVVTGLAWTQFGGETLQIEVIKMAGTGKLKLTGQLGNVMQESAQAAYSYARYHAQEYGIDPNFYKDTDLHLHIPEGAIPKDGPSAGVTMTTAIISILSGKKIKANLAMTGEISLSGDVLPIGGLTEKLIAAKRAKITNIIIPKKNKPSLTEIQDEIKKSLNIMLVDNLAEVLNYALIK
jgi:ATP-dependent Lon protease